MFLHLSVCSQGGKGVYLQGVCIRGGLLTGGGGSAQPAILRTRKSGGTHPIGMLSFFKGGGLSRNVIYKHINIKHVIFCTEK